MNSDKRKIIRIAITGPESTGKSTLAQQLAEHYKTVWVKEFARHYINQLERPYEEKDLMEIAKGQIEDEDKLVSKANNLLFCDTELLVIKIWSEHKFGFVDPFILSENLNRSYDLYLLTDIDLPWKYDIQREHPTNRKYLLEWFERELKLKNANYYTISGRNSERLQKSIRLIDILLSKIGNS